MPLSATTGQGGTILVSQLVGSNINAEFCVENWSLSWNTEPLDITTTCSEGWVDLIPGISQMVATADTYYDASVDPVTTNGLGLQGGNYVTMKFNIGSSGSFITGTFLIDSVTFKNPAKGVVGFSVSAKSTGACTFTLAE
jgi:predicted secreted protein